MAYALDQKANGTATGVAITIGGTAQLAVALCLTRKASAPQGVASVTLGGVAPTGSGTKQTNSTVTAQLFYWINPPTGATSLAFTSGDTVRAVISSYTVGAGTSPALDTGGNYGATGTAITATVTVTPTAQPNLIVSGAAHEAGAVGSAGTGQTALFASATETDEGVWISGATYETTTSTASDAQTFSGSASDVWAIASLVFIESSAVSATATPSTIAVPTSVAVQTLRETFSAGLTEFGRYTNVLTDELGAFREQINEWGQFTFTPVSTQSATATPNTIAVSTSTPAPTVLIGAVTTPSTISVTTSTPASTVSGAARSTPAVLAAVTTLPAPTVMGNAVVQVFTVSVITSIPTPTVLTGMIVNASTISVVTTLPAPTVVGNAVVGASTVSVVTTVPTPTIVLAGSVVVQPATIGVVASIESAWPGYGDGYFIFVSATAITSPTRILAVTSMASTEGVGVTPSTVAAVTSLPAPTIRGAARVTPTTISVVTTVPTPSILAGGSVSVAPVTIAVATTMPSVVVISGAVTVPATILSVASVGVPTVRTGAVLTPSTIALLVSLGTPVVFGGQAGRAVDDPQAVEIVSSGQAILQGSGNGWGASWGGLWGGRTFSEGQARDLTQSGEAVRA